MPVLTVGVQGDQRTHSYAITLRAVTSQDGMTADWYIFLFFINCNVAVHKIMAIVVLSLVQNGASSLLWSLYA